MSAGRTVFSFLPMPFAVIYQSLRRTYAVFLDVITSPNSRPVVACIMFPSSSLSLSPSPSPDLSNGSALSVPSGVVSSLPSSSERFSPCCHMSHSRRFGRRLGLNIRRHSFQRLRLFCPLRWGGFYGSS